MLDFDTPHNDDFKLRKSLHHLADRFGPESDIAPLVVSALADALQNCRSRKVTALYDEWKRLFDIVYGEHSPVHSREVFKRLTRLYRVSAQTDPQQLLFCIHTYFALLMKLVAAELVVHHKTGFAPSLSHELAHSPKEALRTQLTDIENGEIYRRRGIGNFLEAHFSRWYLDAFPARLQDAIRKIALALSVLEEAATSIEPQSTCDPLQKLYQHLVPREVRHRLGEYYTPDWLAEFLLERVGYDGDTDKRLLDPACGSGTFLILAIHRAKRFARTHNQPPAETGRRIVSNILGFDLNPLAVIAARTNYLFALGDLVGQLDHFEIPVHLADSVLCPERTRELSLWPQFLKNGLTATSAGKFDFLVGNPPWIRWGYLSREYRDLTLPMWKEYGLFSLKGQVARLGGGEKDFSMLFTYAAADHYLKKGGKLGFLITQEVFKSKGAGEGFRRFRLGDGESLKVIEAHDFVSVRPFEGAANKTAAIILTKGAETEYPVSYTVWTRKEGIARIPTGLFSEEAFPLLQKRELLAQPIGSPTGAWRAFDKTDQSLATIAGQNPYQARSGAGTEPYGVFRLEVKEVLSNGDLIVRNLVESGKRTVEPIEERIEPDLVFPAVRGSDIERWLAKPRIFILMSQNPQTREPYPEHQMKRQWPRTYAYLARFRDVLLSRGSRTVRELAERTAFYAMFGIGPYTVARYKVVWKRMATDIVAAVLSQAETPFGFKTVIPTDTTALFATDNEPEAHYLCAVINSTPVRRLIQSYSSAGRGFGAPSVMNHVGIPKFDPRHPVHSRLAQFSETLHRIKADSAPDEISLLEKEVDALVFDLFDIKDSRTP